MHEASAGMLLRALPPLATVGSSVTGPKLGVAGPQVHALERDQVAGQRAQGIRGAQRLAVRRVTGPAGLAQLEHQQPLLRHGDVEPGRLAHDDRLGPRPRRDSSGTSASVPLPPVSSSQTRVEQQRDAERPRLEPQKGGHHRRDRGLGVVRAQAVDAALLHRDLVRRPGPPRRARDGVEVAVEAQHRPFAVGHEEVVAEPLDLHAERPQPRLQVAAQRLLLVRQRGNGDQLAVQREQFGVGHFPMAPASPAAGAAASDGASSAVSRTMSVPEPSLVKTSTNRFARAL